MKKDKCCEYWGVKLLILGLLIILNTYYNWVNWAYFVGGVIAIKGLLSIAWPDM